MYVPSNNQSYSILLAVLVISLLLFLLDFLVFGTPNMVLFVLLLTLHPRI